MAEPIKTRFNHLECGIRNTHPRDHVMYMGLHIGIGATKRIRLIVVHVQRRCGYMSNCFDLTTCSWATVCKTVRPICYRTIAGAPAPRGQRGRLPPCPCCTGAHGGREMPFTTIQVILYIKRASLEDSASISHNTDVVKLSEIIDLQELTSEAQELPVYLNLHNRNRLLPSPT